MLNGAPESAMSNGLKRSPQGKCGPKHENIAFSPEKGMIIPDLVDGVIQCVEILYRDEVRSELESIMPSRP
jgi:hypothetical protein